MKMDSPLFCQITGPEIIMNRDTPQNDTDDLETLSSERIEEKTAVPFTIFEKHDRQLLMLLLSMIGFWSTSSSPIYFPAIPTVARYFDISNSLSNISVVAYLILQGLAPSVSCSLADAFGMRPVLICSLLGFVASCIAISQADAYWLLVMLRCFQSASIAPVIAIGSGVSGDVCTRENRGGFIGTVGGFQLIGNGFGAVIGAGLISGFNSWRAIFIYLSIGGGVSLISSALFLPETSRQLVGNGSIKPSGWEHKSLLIYLPHFRKMLTNDMETLEPRKKFDLFATFHILFHWDVIIALAPCGLIFGSWTAMLASVSSVLEAAPFNYTVMHVGYVYLPQGVATLIGSFTTGSVLNKYYRYRLKQYNDAAEADEVKAPELLTELQEYHSEIEEAHSQYGGDDIEPKSKLEDVQSTSRSERAPFDFARARLDVSIVPIVIFTIGLLMFGWCLEYKVHIATIYISTMLVGLSSGSMISCITTLLVDKFPSQGHSSSSCVNMMRCWLAALFVGVLDKMLSRMGVGGTFTLLTGSCVVSSALMFYWFYSKRAYT